MAMKSIFETENHPILIICIPQPPQLILGRIEKYSERRSEGIFPKFASVSRIVTLQTCFG